MPPCPDCPCDPSAECDTNKSKKPVRYGDGEISHSETDLSGGGFGIGWSHTREYANQAPDNSVGINGNSWLTPRESVLSSISSTRMSVVRGMESSLWFTKVGSDWVADYGVTDKLTESEGGELWTLTDSSGTREEFHGVVSGVAGPLRGKLKRIVAPGGAVAVLERDSLGRLVSFLIGSGGRSVEYEYSYNPQGRLAEVVRRVDGVDSRKAVYRYYSYESYGNPGDLKTAEVLSWSGTGWQQLTTSYYRYYTALDSGGFVYGLRYVVGAEAYKRMVSAGVPPETAGNEVVSGYADYYFEYDWARRVTREKVNAGSEEYTFAYSGGPFGNAPNEWKFKTVETRPDGSQVIVYSNHVFQVILKIIKKGADEWYDFKRYNANYKRTLRASSEAVESYSEILPDLVTLKTSEGLIRGDVWYDSTDNSSGSARNMRHYSYVKKGSAGAEIKLESSKYLTQMDGGGSAVLLVEHTVYRSESGGGSEPSVTAYGYAFHVGTVQVARQTTTLPVVPTDQNGDGETYQTVQDYDLLGSPTWSKDELGYITLRSYDGVIGTLRQEIRDVDSLVVPDCPWETPEGGGLNLVTDYESDLIGRTTQELGPPHEIDLDGVATVVRSARFTVYRDDIFEQWSAAGYATGEAPGYNYTTVDPVSIVRSNASGEKTDQITSRRDTCGRLSGAEVFPQSLWLSWTSSFYDKGQLLTRERSYFVIPSSGVGFEGENYGQTRYGYDALGVLNRMRTPGGTITRQVFDPRGLVTEVWMGTDDTGATNADPSGGGAPGNNMVAVRLSEYDGGDNGGNGLLTKETLPVTDSVNRVTNYSYDWRDRRTVVDGELTQYETTGYDNLGRVVEMVRRNGSAGGAIWNREVTRFDARGAVYQQLTYGASTTISLHRDRWYDGKGRLIKELNPGKSVWIKTLYDGVGKEVESFLCYLPSGSEGATNSVADNIVIEQTVTCYDAASNVVESREYLRFHDATGLGPLQGPAGDQPRSRIYYNCNWTDGTGRVIATAEYGTNSGSPVVRPALVPESTDAVLVSRTFYDSAGNVWATESPSGILDTRSYDAMGRQTTAVENDTGAQPSEGASRTSQYAYTLDGALAKLVVKNDATGDQVTRWEHGTTLEDSGVASTILLRAKELPVEDGGDPGLDRVEYSYNRQGEVTMMMDQNGTEHEYMYDLLGRLTHDRVTELGEGVDGYCRQIRTSYLPSGNINSSETYPDSNPGSTDLMTRVYYQYTNFGQIYAIYSDYIPTGLHAAISYDRSNGSGNNTRLESMNYPYGWPYDRHLQYAYGEAGSIDDRLSRVTKITDWNTDTVLAEYKYIGASTVIETTYPEPGVKLSYVKRIGEPDGDSDDPYNGLDVFGRIQDHRWMKGASTLERQQYGYTRDSLIQWRKNLVAAGGEDNFYDYDGLQQVKESQRGTLNFGRTAISGTPSAQEAWTYDPAGNWLAYDTAEEGGAVIQQSRSHNPVNEITAIDGLAAITGFDRAGNMTRYSPGEASGSGIRRTMKWDAWNRMVEVYITGVDPGPVSSSWAENWIKVELQYDGLSRQVRKIASSSGEPDDDLLYIWDANWKCLETRIPYSSIANQQFVYGARGRNDLILRDSSFFAPSSSSSSDHPSSSEPPPPPSSSSSAPAPSYARTGRAFHSLAEIPAELSGFPDNFHHRFYALCDSMGSKMAITGRYGDLVERYRYSAFGEVTFLSPSFAVIQSSEYHWTTLFHGEERDVATGWYNYGYRFYIPELGRWPSRDPIGEQGGLNLYAFVGNDAVSKIDFRGLATVTTGVWELWSITSTFGVWAFTGDPETNDIARTRISMFEDHNIKETNEKGLCCAEVISAKKITLNVATYYPSWGSAKSIMTRRGYQEMIEHEGRRQYAYVQGKRKLLEPISDTGSIALRCGKICKEKPGVAKKLLHDYLEDNQFKAVTVFNDYEDAAQYLVGQENNNSWWRYSSDGRFDGFKKTVKVPSPPDPKWNDCPK